jgi:hypothetical protein
MAAVRPEALPAAVLAALLAVVPTVVLTVSLVVQGYARNVPTRLIRIARIQLTEVDTHCDASWGFTGWKLCTALLRGVRFGNSPRAAPEKKG